MPATPSGSKKATAKRKQCTRSSPAHTPKKCDTEKVGKASEDPVMRALRSVHLSHSNLNGRIQVLESRPSPTSTICSSMPAVYSAAAAFDPSTADPSGTLLSFLQPLQYHPTYARKSSQEFKILCPDATPLGMPSPPFALTVLD
ncbi:hypothetical protein E1301_Tti018828 [Triplophysa tibetana]|uniref:Uncharacterized protein n=1 Tax=Triplophysa tibetana TaxID=1572043 RepID=A0A5A9P9I8_9TELE|nr:hypothetical protein E1301_Tti018828 [Triplophysa tibetana]